MTPGDAAARALVVAVALALGFLNAYCALVAVWLPMRITFAAFAIGCAAVAARTITDR